MNFWLVKCRKYLPDREGWSWDSYFDGSDSDYSRDDTWGGPEWIRSPQSKMFIREDVAKGDLVVCYQSEGRRICGFTKMAGDGRDVPKGSGDFNMLYLSARSKGICIEPELTVEQVRATGCDPEWLRKGQGTVFPLSTDEFNGIVRAVRICCPGMEEVLERWLKRVGVDAGLDADEESLQEEPPIGGAGFSTDPARNAKVEQAAIRIVKQHFRQKGWDVQDRQLDCCGFDLTFTKGKSQRKDVEVKGAFGLRDGFLITFGEFRQAKSNPNFEIWIVTEALSPAPSVKHLTGPEFLAAFELQPIQFMARRRS